MSQQAATLAAVAGRRPVATGPVTARSRRGGLAPLRVVPEAIQRTGNAGFTGVCLALMVVGLGTLLMLNTSLAQGAFTLAGLQAQAGVLTDTREQLTADIDNQGSPRTLAARAQELGMVPAQSMAFIRLSDGAIVGTATPASPNQRLTIITSPSVPVAAATPPPAPATAATPAAQPSATAKPATATPTGTATKTAGASGKPATTTNPTTRTNPTSPAAAR